MKKATNLFFSITLLASAGSFVVACHNPSSPIIINDTIDLANYAKKIEQKRVELTKDEGDATLSPNIPRASEILNSILDNGEVANTDFIKKLRAYGDTIGEGDDGHNLGIDIVSTSYQRGVSLGELSLTQKFGVPNTYSLYDSFYKYVEPDGVTIRTDISKLLTDLGSFDFQGNDQPTADLILLAFDSVNHTSLATEGKATVSNITTTSATIDASNSSSYKGTANVIFTKGEPVDNRKDLSTIKPDLGEISDNEDATIIAAINEKNSLSLTSSDITVAVNETNDGATVSAASDSDKYTGSVEVKFTVTPQPDERTDLSNITGTELGTISDTDPATIVSAMNAKNDGLGLTTDDVDITVNGDSTGATVAAKAESENFIGTVEVTFDVTPSIKSLDTVITNTTLNEIDDNTPETILNAVVTANDTVDRDQIEVDKDSITATGATIKAIDGSEVYEGSVGVTFAAKLQDVTSAIKVKALEDVGNPTEENIKAKLKTLNEDLNTDELSVTDITETSATVSAIENSTVYTGSTGVTFTSTSTVDLATLITDPELGTITEDTDDAVLAALKDKYPDLNYDEIVLTRNGDGTATVAAATESTVYTGSATVKYTVEVPAVDLATIIHEKELGEIADATDESIIAAINEKNNLTENPLTVDDISIALNDADTPTGATITAKDTTKYSGTVDVTFSLPVVLPELSTVLTTKELGTLDDNEPATILAKVKEANPSVDETQIEVAADPAPTETAATIKVIDDSTVYAAGTVEVTYDIKAPAVDLSTVIGKTELGTLDSAEPEVILAAINKTNSLTDDAALTLDDINIAVNGDSTGATVTAKDTNKYSGSVPVTFTVKTIPDVTDLSTLTGTALGELPDTQDQTIVDAVNTANEGLALTVADVTITLNDADAPTGATITANESSTNFTGTMNVDFTVAAEQKLIMNYHYLLGDDEDNNEPTGPIFNYTDYTMAIVITNTSWTFGVNKKHQIFIPYAIKYIDGE